MISSAIRSNRRTPGRWSTRSKTRFIVPSVNFMMFAFVAQATLVRCSLRANSNANRAIFSLPFTLISFRHCATPGVCMCSMPA